MAYLVPPLVQTESNSGDHYILFEDSTTGVLVPRTDSGLIYSPPDNKITTGILKVNVANGTAPLQVTSTTLVTNLNVEFLGGKRASDFAPASYVDQDVKTTASPTFNKVSANEINSGPVSIKYNATSKTLDFIFV